MTERIFAVVLIIIVVSLLWVLSQDKDESWNDEDRYGW